MGQLKDILSVSGQPGLFKFVSQARNGIIAEGLEDKKRTRFSATSKISALEDIAVYTDEKEMPLLDVFRAMKEKIDAGETVDPKADPETLKSFFESVLPNYDKGRVYVSDIKKMIKWFFILDKLGIDFFARDEEEAEDEKKTDADKNKEKDKEKKENKPATKKTKAKASKSEKKENTPDE
jgi:hypothetical protein